MFKEIHSSSHFFISSYFEMLASKVVLHRSK